MDDKREVKVLDLNIDENNKPLPPDPKTKDIQKSAKLRSVAMGSDPNWCVVGTLNGDLRLISVNEWKQKHLFKKARLHWVQEIKFSPEGSRFCAGGHDQKAQIYEISNGKIIAKHLMTGHSSYITHIDWSTDGSALHTTCGAYELLFWTSTGKRVPGGASANKDEDWHTWSTTLGWPVQGIFPKEWDGTDINMVDRSSQYTSEGYRLLAMGTDRSTVGLFVYPALRKNCPYNSYGGHSSHVTNVKFSADNTRIFSTGGEDQCVFQWKVNGEFKEKD